MSLFFFGGAALQTATATTPADTPPSVTAEDSLAVRTLTVTITDSDGNPAPTFSITMTADSVAVTPSGSGAGPWTYTVPSSALDTELAWEVVATNTEGTAVASGSETVPADLTETATLTLEADNTATGEVADGVFTITITQSSDYPIYAQYDEGNGPGAYVRNTADFADGPILLYPGDITGDTEVGAVLTLGTPPLWIYEGTVATSEPADPSLNWQADTLGNGTFANLSDTDTAYEVTASEQGDTLHIAYSITDGNGTNADDSSLPVSIPAAPSDTVAPTFVSGVPVDGATDVAIDANLVLTFSEGISAGSGGEFYLYATSGPTLIETFDVGTGNGDDSGTIAISGTDVTINPGSNLSQGTGYSVRWNAGAVEDAASNGVAANTGDTLYNFVTTQAPSGGITYIGQYASLGVNLATYTFSSIPFTGGDAIIAVSAARNATITLSSMNVGGSPASVVTDGSTSALFPTSGQTATAFYRITSPGSSSSVEVNFSAFTQGCFITVYEVPSGTTVHDVAGDAEVEASAPWTKSVTIDVEEGGSVLAIGQTRSPTVLDFDLLAGGTQRGTVRNINVSNWSGIAFDALEISAETGRTITIGDTQTIGNATSLVAISLTPP